MTEGRSPDPDVTRTRDGDPAHLSRGSVLDDRYRVEEILGVGGMGIVYRAHDLELDIDVALKTLHAERAADAERVDRFRRELVLARQVSHPNVVRIHDIGQEEGRYFITMDLVEGRSLRDVLDTEGSLHPDRVETVIRQLASALAAAHDKGVVHRDLKPGNVLLGEDDTAYITDFGIARSIGGEGLTRTGTVVGTPLYVSPEQAEGGVVDGRSDLYSLGLMALEMLRGEPPFEGETSSEILARRLAGDVEVEPLPPDCSEALAEVVRRLVRRDPRDRYDGGADVVAALAATGSRARSRLRSVALGLGIVAAAVGSLLWLYFVVSERRGSVPADEETPAAAAPSVAVLPFTDETGTEQLAWLSHGVAEMLAAALEEAPALRVVDSLRLFRTVSDLGLQTTGLDPSGLRTVAELVGADHLVRGRLRSLPEGFRIEAQLLDLELEVVDSFVVTTNSVEDLDRSVGELAAQLQAALDVGGDAEQAVRETVAAAERTYVEGLAHLSEGRTDDAIASLESTVGEDPEFTQAWLQLSSAYVDAGRTDDALEAAKRAVETAPPGRGPLALESRAQRALLEGDKEGAQEALRQLVERSPHDVSARMKLAQAYGEAGMFEPAIETLRWVTRLDPQHPRAWYLLAKYSIQSGNSRPAVDDYLVRALVIQNRLDNAQARADVLNAFGVGYEDLGELDEAREYYERAAVLRQEIGDRRGYATTLRNLAHLESVRGEYETANERLRQAAEVFEELGNRRGVADVANQIGLLNERRGAYQQALDAYREGLRLRRELGDRRGIAESLNNVGFAYYLLGDYDNALVYWQQALELFRDSGNREGMVWARQSIGQLELARGSWVGAAKSFHTSLEASRELEALDTEAVALGYLGRLAQLEGRFTAALETYDEALGILETIGDRRGLVEFTLYRAEALLEIGRRQDTREALDRVEAWLEDSGNEEQRALLSSLRARLELMEGDVGAASREVDRARSAAQRSHSVTAGLRSRLDAARVALAGGREAAARRELATLATEAERLDHVVLQLPIFEHLATAELRTGEPGAAEATASRALGVLPDGVSYSGAYRLHELRARALAAQGRTDAAEAALVQARQEIERIASGLDEASRRAFLEREEIADIVERTDVPAA